MLAHLPRTALITWAALVLATVASWWVGSGHGLGREAAGAVVLAIATAKAAVIALEFMELRGAAPRLVAAVLGTLVAGGAGLVALLLSA